MARPCGCAPGCGCAAEAEPPLHLEGNGSTLDPWKFSIEYDGREGCEGLAACVGENLGPGLIYDEGSGRIQAKLEPGGGMRFGPGEGLATDEGPPPPDPCARTVDTLPEAPNVVGADRCAGLLFPWNSPYGVDYCVANQVDIIGAYISATADGVGWVAESEAGTVLNTRSSIYLSESARRLQSDTITSTRNYAGDVDDPYPYPEGSRGDRRGGWYGWLARTYDNWLLPELLSRIGGRAVAMLHCHVSGDTAATEQANVQAAIRGALLSCRQGSVIIATREIENATTALNAGVTAALASPPPDTWGETALPWLVEEVTGAGIQWVLLYRDYDNSVFTAYAEAGLDVLMWGATRHSDRQRVADLGARGGYGMDPAYYRGPDTYDYRGTDDPWTHRRMGLGQLTYATDRRSVLGPDVRGYTQGQPESGPQHEDDQGLVIPPDFGRGVGRPAILAGWLCPLPDPERYRISLQMKCMTLGGTPRNRMGLLFGAETDTDPYGWPQDDPDRNPAGMPEGQKLMYRASISTNGTLTLGKWASAEESLTVLDQVETPALVEEVWNRYELVVTSERITFTRFTAAGDEYSVTTDDTQYRGGYAWVEKEESYGDNEPAPFRGKVKNLQLLPVEE